jgi:hypothetical protein
VDSTLPRPAPELVERVVEEKLEKLRERLKQEMVSVSVPMEAISHVIPKAETGRSIEIVEVELAKSRKARDEYPEGSVDYRCLNPRVQVLKAELAALQAAHEIRTGASRGVEIVREELAKARGIRNQYPEGSNDYRRLDHPVQRLKKELTGLEAIKKSAE